MKIPDVPRIHSVSYLGLRENSAQVSSIIPARGFPYLSTSLLGNRLLINFPETGSMINTAGGPRTTYGARGEIHTPHDFCSFFRNHFKLKRPRRIARHLFGVHQPKYKFFPGGIFEICFFDIFPGKNIALGTPRRTSKINYQRQLFLHSFITEFVKNGTARLINFRYPVFIGKPENGRKLLRHAGLWGKHP